MIARILCSLVALAGVAACRPSEPGMRDTARQASQAVLDSSHPAAERSNGDSISDNGAAQVVQQYYDDITAQDYDGAYALWEQSGRVSGKTRTEFTAGFARTAAVHVTIHGEPGMEGAAGSQYATVPVDVEATLSDGRKQHFTGTYTLRRAMVDGATAEQRTWHIYSADLHSTSG